MLSCVPDAREGPVRVSCCSCGHLCCHYRSPPSRAAHLGPPIHPPDSSCSPCRSFPLAGTPSGDSRPPTSPFSPLRSQLKFRLLRRPSWAASANMSPLYYLNLFYFLPSTQNRRKSSRSLFVYRQQNWKCRGRKNFATLVYSW